MGIFDAFTSAGDPSQGGLMGMFANPQTAGLLGMAGGLLQAAGPSRIPVTMGQALGAGVQGMEQGVGNAFQTQQQLLRMRAMQGLMGGDPGQSGAPQAGPSYSAMFGPLSAAPGTMAPASDVGSAGSSAGSGAPAAGPSIYGRSTQQLFNQGMLMNMAGIQGGGDLMRVAVEHDPTLAMQMPTDSQKMAAAAYGYGTPEYQSALQSQVQKAGYIPPTALRTPIYYDPRSGTTKVVPADQLAAGYGAQYGAEARAQAGFKPMQVWDPNYVDPTTGAKGGFVFQTAANMADAANGNGATAPQVPAGIRNNNFGNIKGANGQFATYDTPQDGVNAADQLLATYGSKHGINTIAGIANRWAPAGDGSNNPAQKAAAMAAASGVGVNQPINLADPATRARILPALFDTETPGWRNAMGGPGNPAPTVAPAASPAPTRPGPMAAQPPVGYTPATNAAQTASSKQMADSYKALADSDASYQQSRGALNDMIALAKQFGPIDSGLSKLPEGAHNWDSNVASYDKAHATFVSNQYNALSAGTDASKGTVDSMVPSSDKPLDTKLHGLGMQLNNLDYRHLETQLMTPAFQSGDQKAYTTLNAQFHNTVKPEMMPTVMPILQMNGAQQQAAVQAAVKANPALRPAFQTLFNAGMLK
jgi:hypothetical protein